MGFTILNQSDNYIILRSITNEDLNQFENVLRRIFRITINMGENCLNMIQSENYQNLKS